jgi:hypothetical protein
MGKVQNVIGKMSVLSDLQGPAKKTTVFRNNAARVVVVVVQQWRGYIDECWYTCHF